MWLYTIQMYFHVIFQSESFAYIWKFGQLFHLRVGGGWPNMPPCLLAAREGANPSSFWMFCRIDMVHKM